jgi:tetratricopeptide (TPR) repeat protein
VRATEQLQLASAAAGRNEDAVDDFIRGRLAAAQRRLSAEEENLTLVEALDEVWMNLGIHRDRPDGSDYASREPLYLQVRAALARCDIQVGETPLDQARAWLADKPSELAVQVRATVPLALEAAPSAHRDWLLAWLNQACSNPFETRVHEALAAQDVAALTDLLDDPDWTKMPLLLRLRALQRLPAALTARRIDELRRLRREHLDNPYAQFELVRTVLDAKAGSGDELADSLARAVDLRPGNPRLRMAYGIALQSKGDLQGGVALLRRTIEMAPDLAEAHFTLALALGRQNELRTAITHAREVVRLQPEYAEGHYYLANLLQRQHDYPSAIAALREAIRLNPDYVNARYNLGYLLAQTEDYPGAIRNLRVAVEHRPSFFEAQYWLGIALGRAGDFAAAIPPLREAVRLRPHTAQTWNDLGTVLNAVNDLTGALAACEQALRLQPVYPEASFISGVIKQQFGDLEGSKAALAKAIEHKPDFAAALHYQALTFMYQGDFADGLALVRKADVLSKTVPGWNLPSAAIVQAGERFVEWDARFEQLLRDAVIPQTVDEQVQFATFCAAKRRHGVAARVLATALLAKPDQKAIYCLDAAKHAVLAAFAADTDDSPDNQKQRADFCMQAHGWLRHQVELNEASLGKKSQEGDNAVRLRAQWMKHHRDFASVREPEQLAKLPANEQALWRQLWQDVDRQLERVALP